MQTDKKIKVLIALDFNPTAQKVAEEGYLYARAMDAEVTLLHVMTDPMYYAPTQYSPIMGFSGYMPVGPLQLESVDGLKKASQSFLDKSRNHLGDKDIMTLVREGDIADSILKTAIDLKADIIIMGSHSKKWLEDIVMGSVAHTVLHHSLIPLLIIPTKRT